MMRLDPKLNAPLPRPADRWDTRFGYVWYNDEEIFRDSEDDLARKARQLADIGCTRDRFLAAALHAHQIRERYTIIDLARAAGILPTAAEGIVDRYLMD